MDRSNNRNLNALHILQNVKSPEFVILGHTCSFLELRKDFFFFLQYLIKEKLRRAEEQNADSSTGPISTFHKGMWDSLDKFAH